MKKFSLLAIILSLYVSSVYGQCTNQVTHLNGSMSVNGVMVTVGSSGFITSNSSYCPVTSPYFIGYNYDSVYSSTGSYSFSFSPAVSMATLNFSGISNTPGNSEEVRLFVNGDHYPISAPGSLNGCDPMAVLTAQGNIAGCSDCPVSGWMETPVDGPIYTLTVEDTVVSGNPAGAIFSLFICDSISTGIAEKNTTGKIDFSPNPFVNQTILKFPPVRQKATLTLININGQLLKKVSNITNGHVLINRDGIPSGIYFFMLKTDDRIIGTGKLIAE